MMQGSHHHTSPQILSAGNKWWETRHTHKPQACEGHAMKCKKLNTQAKGQWTACDIYLPDSVFTHGQLYVALR